MNISVIEPAGTSGDPVRLFNTLTRQVAGFQPAHPPDVGMYSCGPTVYADQHIGNMRAYVFADTLKRVLMRSGFRVRHVINITDVGHLTSDADTGEDKLELAAQREHRNAWDIAKHYATEFKADLTRLRVLDPDVWCKATDHIPQMIAFAQALDRAGWCYLLPSGLYFDTSKVSGYGNLARLNLSGQRAGARVQVVPGKRNPHDFGVWRTSASVDARQMEWDSPWGRGAPGWHLECSVMSMEYLGAHFDIHTGGVDHVTVHHPNEIAQSEAYLADGAPWVRWWLHGEFMRFRGAKISKSAGGGVLVRDLINHGYHPLVYRFLLLQAHYRSQTEFSWTAMDGASTGLRRLIDRFASARHAAPGVETGRTQIYLDAFNQAIREDLNTPRALAAVAAAARDHELADHELTMLARQFESVLAIGLADLVPGDLELRKAHVSVKEAEIEELMEARSAARAARDYVMSDQLREQLAKLGVAIEDQPGAASTWRWA